MKTVLHLIHTHPLLALTLAYISGIAVSACCALPLPMILLSAAIPASLLLYCCLYRIMTCGLLAALLLFFLTGLYQGTISSREPASPDHIYNLIAEPTDGVAIGQLLAMPTFDGTASQARIELRSIRRHAAERFIPAKGMVLLRLTGPWPLSYPPGTLLAIRAVFQRPSRYGVPGTFDYPAYLAGQNIWVTGFLRSPAQLSHIPDATHWVEQLRFFPEQLRTDIGRFLDHNTPPGLEGLYRAILLGDRSRISEQTLEKFTASGAMHILAISGVHMTLIGTMLFFMVYWLLRRSEWLILRWNLRKLAGLLCLPILAGYVLLAGSNTPVVRAGIMSAILILSFCTDRPRSLPALIAFGALLILAHSPQALFTASFQLSFVAFSAIMIFTPVIQKILAPPKADGKRGKKSLSISRWVAAALLASCAAVLGTAPIVIYHFHRFPLAGPVANLIIEPLICLWALPIGFLALPCIPLVPDLAAFLLHLGGLGLHLAIPAAGFFEQMSHATLWPTSPGPILIACYYGTFFYAALIATNFSATELRAISRQAAHFVPFSICLCLLLFPIDRFFPKKIESPVVYILDVGQGSATLIQLANGKNILIDCGGSAYAKESVGQRIVSPFLWSQGITRIDTIIITHPDADHYNGVPFLIEHFSPSHLWVNTQTEGSREYRDMLRLAEKKGAQVTRAERGTALLEGGTSIHCITNTTSAQTDGHERNTGLIIQLTTGGSSILFPGDIPGSTEEQLLQQQAMVKSGILLAAHHGSPSSNSPRFLRYVDPRLILVSAGRSRGNIFPSLALRQYCRRQDLPLLVTAETGTVRIDLKTDAAIVSVLKDPHDNPLRRRTAKWLATQRIEAHRPETGVTRLP